MRTVAAWTLALLAIIGMGVGIEAGVGVNAEFTALTLVHNAGCQDAFSYKDRLFSTGEICAELTPPYADLTAVTTPNTMPPTLSSRCPVIIPLSVPANLYLTLVVGPDWAIAVGGQNTRVQRHIVASYISERVTGTVLAGDC
jgi:hypothetical protein